WSERVATLLYIGLHLALAMAAASALAAPIGLFYGRAWMGLAAALLVNFVFPLFLLASMEADTLLTPYSPVIFGSVMRVFGGWLTVYVESLLVLGFAGGLVAAGLVFVPILTLLLAAPILATAIFVDGRLYGRLA